MKLKELFKKRSVSQDIAKGIAIFLVMIVHSLQVNQIIGSVIGVLFGYIMPFFLFMAGYNYNDKGLSVKENIKRRTWQLLKPFLIFSFGIFIVMGSYFLIKGEATIIELLKSFFIFIMSKWGLGYLGWEFNQVLFQRILGPCWFIQFLIIANLVFIPFEKYTRDNKNRTISSVILLSGISVLLIKFNIILPWGIQNSFAIAGLMLIATYCKKNNLLLNDSHSTKWRIINCIICILTIALFQLSYSSAGYVGAGELGRVLGGVEVYVMYIMAICGTYFLINFCKLLEKTKYVSKYFCFLGKNSMLILMVHMSIVHIIKDIMNLEQRNAAEKLFGDSTNPKEIVATIIIISVVSLFVKLYNKLTNKEC